MKFMKENMNRLLIAVFFALLNLVITGCMLGFDNSNMTREAGLSKMACYNSFEEFAYTSTVEGYGTGLPTEPWEIKSTFPDEFIGDYHIRGLRIQVMFTRSVNGSQEIWLARPSRFLEEDTQSIFIFHPISGEWQTVSDNVDGTDAFIRGVYQAGDGTIWGWNGWDWNKNTPSGPIMSKYNEQTQKFEFAPGMLEYPLTDEGERVGHGSDFDSQGNIWILVSKDGIYLYNFITQTTIKQLDLKDITVSNLEGLSDGSIYFTDNTYSQRSQDNSRPGVFDGMLYQYIPESKELLELGNPDEEWPWFGSMFETSRGQVWFSAVGYRDLQDGSWHLLHSDPEYAIKRAGHQGSSSPNITLESSNGLLWFNKENEDILTGTAWYDPDTGDGCMFTDVSARIVEDDQQQLWMFADGKLYSLSLAPKD